MNAKAGRDALVAGVLTVAVSLALTALIDGRIGGGDIPLSIAAGVGAAIGIWWYRARKPGS